MGLCVVLLFERLFLMLLYDCFIIRGMIVL